MGKTKQTDFSVGQKVLAEVGWLSQEGLEIVSVARLLLRIDLLAGVVN